MNKELQKLLKQINDKKNEVKSLVNDGKLDKAKTAKEELKELQNKFDLLYDLDEDEQGGIADKVNKGTAKQVGGEKKVDKKNLVKAFVNIVKAGFLHREADEADVEVYKNALTSDTTAGSEGEVGIGVTIPEDIRTDIIELRRSSDNLEQYVNVEGVVTKTGTRNIEVDAESTPFDNVDEAADFPEMDEPEFLPIEYKVKKKGGILKMTAELLEDTAANIMAYINKCHVTLWDLGEADDNFSDDDAEGVTLSLQVTIFSKEDEVELAREIKSLMKENGFSFEGRNGDDSKPEDGIYMKAQRFTKYYESEEKS
jgi:HK97 family phage major capsid protein